MHVTINRHDRDVIYDGLMTDLSAIGDVFIDLHNDEPASAKRLYRRFEVELRLLDDLGWEKEPEAERFELTMPARELRPVIERVYWSAVGSLADHPADTPIMPDTATLHAITDRLDHVIANGEPEQAKALLAILIADLCIHSRTEVLPTYRVGAPTVCAPTSSVGDTGLEPVTSALSRRRSPS
jgi:hypothetical protein